MYDHAKWLRSTWASSSSPDDRTFPGKPATSDELREDFPGGLVVKNPPATQETQIRFRGREDPLEGTAWQLTPLFLPGERHGQRSLVGYSPWGAKSATRLE